MLLSRGRDAASLQLLELIVQAYEASHLINFFHALLHPELLFEAVDDRIFHGLGTSQGFKGARSPASVFGLLACHLLKALADNLDLILRPPMPYVMFR
jgi:hypothetical protein